MKMNLAFQDGFLDYYLGVLMESISSEGR